MAGRFFSRTSHIRLSSGCQVLAFASASAVSVRSVVTTAEVQTENRKLSSRHRVCITNWSIVLKRGHGIWTRESPFDVSDKYPDLDVTSKQFRGDFEGLLDFLKGKGYEGIEISVGDLRNAGYFPEYVSDEEIACTMRAACAKTGVKLIGSLLHVTDGGPRLGASVRNGLDYNSPSFWENLCKVLDLEKSNGSEYVTFQIALPNEMNGTGGSYRNDEEYLKLSANRIHRLQQECFERGLNFYVEVHIERVSEDPEAFCKIFDYCPSYFEVNADISHYLYRNIRRGPHFDRIMQRVGHCHIRMCRVHGDLSAVPGVHLDHIGPLGDPVEDWNEKGVTYQAVEAMRPALERGLSSGAICGEAGPAFLVPDALRLDTQLVPLYRYMACMADGGQPRGNPFETFRVE